MIEIKVPNTKKRFLVQLQVQAETRNIIVSMDVTCGNMADIHGIVYGRILEDYNDTPYEITCILKYFL